MSSFGLLYSGATGSQSASFGIDIAQDSFTELSEFFYAIISGFQLASGGNSIVITDEIRNRVIFSPQAEVTISDDDSKLLI